MTTYGERWNHLAPRYAERRQRKMLSLDGGGIRGMITLQILRRIEDVVGQRLCDYFDYIGGTSTGAIIAAGLARGKSVDELISFYRSAGPDMFDARKLWLRWKSFYTADPLVKQLKDVFGADTTLEPQHLQTLLLIVTRNATTDSPWPISSNPDAKYNDTARADCNLFVKLWQLVRASTAAPVYFPPEVIQWSQGVDKQFVFVDGGTTAYNNPAFLMYRMATLEPYKLNWDTGERNLLIVSVGTGGAPGDAQTADSPEMNLGSNLKALALAVMSAAQVDQDVNCRTVGRCIFGPSIDREMTDLISPEPLTQDLGRKFLYVRYDADLSDEGVRKLPGCENVVAAKVRELDAVTQIANLELIGTAVAASVDRRHFGAFLP